MKKMFILASILAFSMTTALAVEQTAAPKPVQLPAEKAQMQPRPPHRPDFKKEQFEKRLKLTDKQKEKAKEIHKQGIEEMKPIMEQIKSKRQEARAVELSKIAPQFQKEKLDAINGDIRNLEKQAHELRMKNMKEFEKILTKKQRKELEKMKQEGRREFKREHRRPECHGCGPNFGHGPETPPPAPEKE